jgi:hypothetical protein
VVDEYYTALAVLARTTFDADSEGRGDALRFFDLYLETTFQWVLESSLHDPRGFASVSVDLVSRLMELEDADRQLGIVTWNVTRALRGYLIARLQGTRCADSQFDGVAVESFNFALRRRNVLPAAVAPLGPNETRPSRTLGRARINVYWQTADARRLYDAAVRLRGPEKTPVSIQERRTAAWRLQAEHLLVDLEQWSGTREAIERDYFYQKAVLYTVLADLVPAGPLRVRALRSFVDFLRHTDRDRDGRAIWFMFVNRLLELARSADRATVLDALEESRHPVLALYGRLERLQATTR